MSNLNATCKMAISLLTDWNREIDRIWTDKPPEFIREYKETIAAVIRQLDDASHPDLFE